MSLVLVVVEKSIKNAVYKTLLIKKVSTPS